MKLSLCLAVVGLCPIAAMATDPSEKAGVKYAYLFGESIPKKDAPPSFGINASHVDWWLGDPQTNKLRRLTDPRTGRILVRVRPVDRTIILQQDAKQITLLGPKGGKLTLSKTDGPLAKAGTGSDGNITTFAYSPDGQYLVYADAKERLCRIDLKTMKLTVTGIKRVNRAQGVLYSPDGSRILFERYFRKDNFSPTIFSIHTAGSDFADERKLQEYVDGKTLGFGFLPDGRVGVVGPQHVQGIDSRTGKSGIAFGPWKRKLEFRSFGGFSPDGSSFTFDLGGPYVLRLFAFDTEDEKLTTVRKRYLESFQQMVWVRIEPGR